MKAFVYKGPRDVVVQKVPDAKIGKATDVLVNITTTNICGSDLHMYEGRTSMEPGRIFGHENLGTVIEIGSAVDRVKLGDRVCMPFNISCGSCEISSVGLTGFSLITNPGNAGAAGPDGDLLKSIRSGNDKPVKNEQVKERGALPTWADVFRRNQFYY